MAGIVWYRGLPLDSFDTIIGLDQWMKLSIRLPKLSYLIGPTAGTGSIWTRSPSSGSSAPRASTC